MTKAGTRTGRPAGDAGNKARILDAAQREFADHGFRAATLRRIAARADVDVALLSHYFGNKDGLFAATMELPDGVIELLRGALSAPEKEQGERLTRNYLGLWEDPATRAQMQVLARTTLSSEAATEHIEVLLMDASDHPGVAPLLDGRLTNFTLAMSHLLGVAFLRHLTKSAIITDLDFETLVARTAPAVQLHLSCSLP